MDGRRWRALAALAVASALVAGACSGSQDATTTEGGSDGTAVEDRTTGTTTPVVAPVDYSERGPYQVGRTTLDVEGVEVFVFYPIDDDATAEAEHVTEVSSDLAFPESFRAVAPEFFIQQLPTEHYLDAPASEEGPFPLVLHSHGFSGYPLYATSHLEHTASWGYVVAAPSHPSRNLAASLGGGGATGEADADVNDLERTIAAMDAQNEDQASPLFGSVDADQLAAEGHSAGGGAVGALALRDVGVDTVIGQAPGAPIDVTGIERDAPIDARVAATEAALAQATPPDVPVLYLAGERDGVIPLAAIQAVFDWLAPPKQLVVGWRTPGTTRSSTSARPSRHKAAWWPTPASWARTRPSPRCCASARTGASTATSTPSWVTPSSTTPRWRGCAGCSARIRHRPPWSRSSWRRRSPRPPVRSPPTCSHDDPAGPAGPADRRRRPAVCRQRRAQPSGGSTHR